jgi:hypothetical protein
MRQERVSAVNVVKRKTRGRIVIPRASGIYPTEGFHYQADVVVRDPEVGFFSDPIAK